jgi:hypothetical protein
MNNEILKAVTERVIRMYWDKEVADYLECLGNDNENDILEDMYVLARFFGLSDLVREYDCLPAPPEDDAEPVHGWPNLKKLLRDLPREEDPDCE